MSEEALSAAQVIASALSKAETAERNCEHWKCECARWQKLYTDLGSTLKAQSRSSSEAARALAERIVGTLYDSMDRANWYRDEEGGIAPESLRDLWIDSLAEHLTEAMVGGAGIKPATPRV